MSDSASLDDLAKSRLRPFVKPPIVGHFATYVRGFPMAVTLLLERAHPSAQRDYEFFELPPLAPAADLRTTFREVGTDRQRSWGADAETDDMDPRFKMPPGERQLKLTHLDDPIVWGSLEEYGDDFWTFVTPGRYTVTVTYNSATAEPFEIEVRAPTPLEELELAMARGATRDGMKGRWPPWYDVDFTKIQGPITKTDPLRYYRVVATLASAPDDALDETLIDRLDGLFAPFGALLRAEIFARRKQTDALNAAIDAATTKWDGLGWRVPRIREGRGVIMQR